MKLSSLLGPLLDAKADHELIRKQIIAFETEQKDALEARRESDRKRQAYKRSRDITLRHSDRLLARAEDSSSNLDISGEVKKERKQDFVSPKAQPKNGTCIPDDFEPNLRWANQEGLGMEQAKHEAAQFLDYWRAKAGAGARKRDWPKTWQVWVRNAMSRRPTARAGPPPKPTPTDALKEFAKLKGWTANGPNGSNGHNHDAEQLSADGSGRPGEIVSIRGGIAGRYR